MATNARQAGWRQQLRVLPGGKTSEPPPGPSDDELCDALAQGDTAMAEALYDRLIDVVDGTICRIIGRREEDHDDLVQSSFEQILLTLMRGRFARRCSLASWAARIATHVGLNALRSRRRQRRVLDRHQDSAAVAERVGAGPNPEKQLAVRRDLDRLRDHLGAMDERKASALFLHDALGHDLGEVAELTGVSVAAAQSRLVRGRRELRQRLEADLARDGEEER